MLPQPSRLNFTTSETAIVESAEYRSVSTISGPFIVSFDIEEHDRIEAAVGLTLDPTLRSLYAQRMVATTEWILAELDRQEIRATFFILGTIARSKPDLVRAIHRAGHEVASHGWNHQRLHSMTPETFQDDLRMSLDALQDVTGEPVLGYRAPTFSVVRKTAWAIDILASSGLRYDSSIYPIHHDRYGVPSAPRTPFLARGEHHEILELPPATLQVGRLTLPIGGGGYFRLLPGSWMRHAIDQARCSAQNQAVMLYFHPWEFDPDQPRLPLKQPSRLRTYVGIARSRSRLTALLSGRRFERAIDIAQDVLTRRNALASFSLVD
ncbi:XrtA system polysaccharide deacetylase [Tautonia marina]|uniref:XrtA system polysaccharide deacetylase n=1 Tax=Tautonia marina TaxID=2653855 RepID=UPI001F365AB8|nr:XrtA system polysaccharide deacetylase [Tautonia marina]